MAQIHIWTKAEERCHIQVLLAGAGVVDELTTAHAVNSPVQSEWHRSIYGNGLFAYRPTAALIGYGTPVCVEYGPESCLLMQ